MVKIRIEPSRIAAGRDVELLVTITEEGLVSRVTRGENAGRRLAHSAVVRWMTSLGGVKLSDADGVARATEVPLADDWNRARLHLVAWLQERTYGRVLGAVRLEIGPAG